MSLWNENIEIQFWIVKINFSCCFFYNVKFRNFQINVLLKTTEDCIYVAPVGWLVQYTEISDIAIHLYVFYVRNEISRNLYGDMEEDKNTLLMVIFNIQNTACYSDKIKCVKAVYLIKGNV